MLVSACNSTACFHYYVSCSCTRLRSCLLCIRSCRSFHGSLSLPASFATNSLAPAYPQPFATLFLLLRTLPCILLSLFPAACYEKLSILPSISTLQSFSFILPPFLLHSFTNLPPIQLPRTSTHPSLFHVASPLLPFLPAVLSMSSPPWTLASVMHVSNQGSERRGKERCGIRGN